MMTALRRHKKISLAIGAVIFSTIIWISLSFLDHSDGREPVWGVSFAPTQAQYLGLDWKETYRAILDDLDVDAIRIAALWNEVEKEKGVYDFADLDYQVQAAAKRDKRIILAMGRRLPRWPECHEPTWQHGKTMVETEPDIRRLIETIVTRYRDVPQIAVWQVENEPFLTLFGECPKPDRDVLLREIALVHSLDARPVLITDSGELSTWRRAAPLGDFFGMTMYRVVWNRFVKYWSYDYLIPPAFYRLKARLVGKPLDRLIGAELQAEPWAPRGLLNLEEGEYAKSLSPARLKKNIAFARATGIPEHYLWGAEYWYYLKTQKGDAALWETARGLWDDSRAQDAR